MATLVLEDGVTFSGTPFGASSHASALEAEQDRFGTGEVVFNTGMVGYPESLTDPSYRGQILVFTYPLIGNYGVPSEELDEWPARRSDGTIREGGGFSKNFESENIHVRGVICAQVSETYSHHAAAMSLDAWLKKHNVPGITGVDTRALTKKLREHGVMLGRIASGARIENGKLKIENELQIEDPNTLNLVAEVSCTDVITYEPKSEINNQKSVTVLAYDCGMKRNILRSFLKRGVRVVRVPWDFDLDSYDGQIDGVFCSNGPGDPKTCVPTIHAMKRAIERDVPTFGICLGNQLLALAIGGDTYKLKYGHRGANQPCVEALSSSPSPIGGGEKGVGDRCIITSQNHGFAVDEHLPKGWYVWFRNANDGTVEGIRHESGKFFSVQFHPEATPGPEDANYLFDAFIEVMARETSKKTLVAV